MINDQILTGHELFAALSIDERHRLDDFASEKEFRKDEIIFEYNQPCYHFYMLTEGDVYLQLPANPKEFSFAISKMEINELFGLSPLFNGTRYTASAKCYSDTKVLSIEAKPFRGIMRENSQAGLIIINQIGRIYYARYLNLLKKLQDIVSQVSMVK